MLIIWYITRVFEHVVDLLCYTIKSIQVFYIFFIDVTYPFMFGLLYYSNLPTYPSNREIIYNHHILVITFL